MTVVSGVMAGSVIGYVIGRVIMSGRGVGGRTSAQRALRVTQAGEKLATRTLALPHGQGGRVCPWEHLSLIGRHRARGWGAGGSGPTRPWAPYTPKKLGPRGPLEAGSWLGPWRSSRCSKHQPRNAGAGDRLRVE
jgi:hypothetical protein